MTPDERDLITQLVSLFRDKDGYWLGYGNPAINMKKVADIVFSLEVALISQKAEDARKDYLKENWDHLYIRAGRHLFSVAHITRVYVYGEAVADGLEVYTYEGGANSVTLKGSDAEVFWRKYSGAFLNV